MRSRPGRGLSEISDSGFRQTGTACVRDGLHAPGSPAVTIASMKIFNFIHVVFAGAFYRWALREIDPMHPDLPRILLRKRELAEKQNRIFA
jgi:hypothetical protein